jgi:hypothetical protein
LGLVLLSRALVGQYPLQLGLVTLVSADQWVLGLGTHLQTSLLAVTYQL